MQKKKILVKSWEEIYKSIPIENANKDLINLISEISTKLSLTNENYVYLVELDFGDKIIDKGSIIIKDFEVISNGTFKKSNTDFINEINYSNDPLGLVVKNYLEVFTENKYLNIANKKIYPKPYNVPLNVISQGEFFGAFGTLDFLTKTTRKFNYNEDWYAIAGSICFSVAFNFHLSTDTQYFDQELINKFKSRPEDLSYAGEERIFFAKRYLGDWKTEVIYFPKQFIEFSDVELIKRLEHLLLQIGWKQSSQLRYNLFENKSVSDIIYNLNYKEVKHNEDFLNTLFNYLLKASRGDAYVLKPIEGNHFLNEVVDGFKKEHNDYFRRKSCVEPLIFNYGYLSTPGDWGLASLFKLPVLHNYTIITPTQLVIEIKKINSKITNENNKISDFLLYGRDGNQVDDTTGNRLNEHIQATEELKTMYLQKAFPQASEKLINLTSDEFKHLILIKSE